jgi:hypothetical protein
MGVQPSRAISSIDQSIESEQHGLAVARAGIASDFGSASSFVAYK